MLMLCACVKQTYVPPVDNSKLYEVNQSVSTVTPALLNIINLQESSALLTYIGDVLDANPDLKTLAVTVQAYKEAANVVRGQQMPHIDITTQTGKEKIPNEERGHTLEKTFSFSRSISWSVDIWGKLEDEHDASLLTVQQQENQLQWSKRLLVAKAVETWIEHWVLTKQLQDLEATGEIQNHLSQTVHEGYKNGLVPYKSYLLQKNAEMNDLIEIGNIRFSKTKARYTLNILRGQSPTASFDEINISSTELIVPIPEEISALTLINRPDIVKAYKEIQILDKETSAAYKALLPQLNLNGSLIKSGSSIDNAFDQNVLWQLIGGVTQPIFRGGTLLARAEQKSHEAKAAWWQYQHVVLQALMEVESSLSHEHVLFQDIEQYQSILVNSNKIKENNAEQYLQGETSIEIFLQSKIQALEAKTNLVEKQGDYLKNRVSFALALGEPLETIGVKNDE